VGLAEEATDPTVDAEINERRKPPDLFFVLGGNA